MHRQSAKMRHSGRQECFNVYQVGGGKSGVRRRNNDKAAVSMPVTHRGGKMCRNVVVGPDKFQSKPSSTASTPVFFHQSWLSQ